MGSSLLMTNDLTGYDGQSGCQRQKLFFLWLATSRRNSSTSARPLPPRSPILTQAKEHANCAHITNVRNVSVFHPFLPLAEGLLSTQTGLKRLRLFSITGASFEALFDAA